MSALTPAEIMALRPKVHQLLTRRGIVVPASVLIGITGAYWFVQRVV